MPKQNTFWQVVIPIRQHKAHKLSFNIHSVVIYWTGEASDFQYKD
jgi:hypothetical protein